jgi:orotidine-5'-phosphate decarboxylase
MTVDRHEQPGVGDEEGMVATVAPSDRLNVALDVGGLDEARALVDRLGETVRWYKVGLELFAAAGPQAVAMLKQRGKNVFLDLKLHDIPNTVGRAAVQLASLGVDIVDLHVAAGPEAMQRTAADLNKLGRQRPVVLGVTVLTSTARDAQGEALTAEALIAEVTRRAGEARAAGLDGVVCPAAAATAVRSACGAGFSLLVPGIRPAGSAPGDQRWVATPAAAVAAGARWIVVGRPISAAVDPGAAAQRILDELAGA